MLDAIDPTDQAPTLLKDSVLISFPICPFVARARIVAIEKGVDIKVRFIDLANKPSWFLERSPTGTVPALDTGTHFIFESSVISEFIDECSDGSLHPALAADRALSRAWTEYATKLLMPQYMMMMAGSQAEMDQHRTTLRTAMGKIEAALTAKPYFNGDDFAIVDAAYAPVFVRTAFLLKTRSIDLLVGLPKLQYWAAALTERHSVCQVHGPDHYDQLDEHMAQRGSILAG
ncbi:glutathione S-transferase family protein [Gymnodinialimonas sp. 2305UL16-5]|uniref:glutathione S-transferase family protein n=1 Tax=Gymnodinialimonas mytili TaxID=3126503 RepID=UPI0030B749F6